MALSVSQVYVNLVLVQCSPNHLMMCSMLHMWCAQDPSQRITLARVMRHPWVTRSGAWPLATLREMGGCCAGGSASGGEEEDDCLVTHPQLVPLPDLMATVNVLDVPRQVRPFKQTKLL